MYQALDKRTCPYIYTHSFLKVRMSEFREGLAIQFRIDAAQPVAWTISRCFPLFLDRNLIAEKESLAFCLNSRRDSAEAWGLPACAAGQVYEKARLQAS